MSKEQRVSNTVQMVKNNYYFAKAAIGSLETKNPVLKAAETAGITLASGIIGLANLPITIAKDTVNPDGAFGKYLAFGYQQVKEELASKDDTIPEKINKLVAGGILYTLYGSIVLGTSLINEPFIGASQS